MQDPADSGPSTPAGGPVALATVRTLVDGVEGWLTDGQVAALHEAAAQVPDGGTIVEIGSFRGRSTIVLATSAPAMCTIVAIDPHAGNDRGPQQFEGFAAEAATDHDVFLANLHRAGVADRVRHVRAPSASAHGEVVGPIDLLFVDGAHRFVPARTDLAGWGDRVVPGGVLLVHDSFSSVGVTLALAATMAGRGTWRYDGRVGSLARYQRTRLTLAQRAASVARHVAEVPWFARNLVIKALMVADRSDLARRLGHDGETWPH